jgi:hypothetical protein
LLCCVQDFRAIERGVRAQWAFCISTCHGQKTPIK